MSLLNDFIWWIYKLTPRGRSAWILKKGLQGLQARAKEKRNAKLKVIYSANRLIKQKKLLGFANNKNISKSKKSDHQVIEQVKAKHKEDLVGPGLKITKKGKFKNA